MPERLLSAAACAEIAARAEKATPGPWRVGRLMEGMTERPDGMTPEQAAKWDSLMEERNQYRRDNDGAFVILAGTLANDDLKRVGAASFHGTAKRGQAHATPDPEGLANALAMAAAREDIPALLRTVAELREALKPFAAFYNPERLSLSDVHGWASALTRLSVPAADIDCQDFQRAAAVYRETK